MFPCACKFYNKPHRFRRWQLCLLSLIITSITFTLLVFLLARQSLVIERHSRQKVAAIINTQSVVGLDGNAIFAPQQANTKLASPMNHLLQVEFPLANFSLIQHLITDTKSTAGIAWGDVDNDGDLDLAVGNGSYFSEVVGTPNIPIRQKNQLYVNENNSLRLIWESTEISSTQDLDWGDFDQDGDLDLAVGTQENSLLYGNEDGKLTKHAIYIFPERANTQSLAWADYDGDSDLDLFVANGDMKLRGTTLELTGQPNQLYRNDGLAPETSAPRFTNVWTETVDSFVTTSAAWGDYDQDNDPDLMIANVGTRAQSLQLYKNNEGQFQVYNFSGYGDTLSVAWGHFNGDERLDLAVGNIILPFVPESGFNTVYCNNTLASSSELFTNCWTDPIAGTTTAVAWGDYDNDGDSDLAVANASNVDLPTIGQPNYLYRNDGNVFTRTRFSEDVENTFDIAWGDFDNDGAIDLVTGNSDFESGQPVRVYRNGHISIGDDVVLFATDEDFSRSVAWGDFDRDTDLDLVVGNEGNTKLYKNTLLPSGNRSLELALTFSISEETLSIAWGDYDHDGDLDLAMANRNQPNRIYENQTIQHGPPVFVSVWEADVAENSREIVWGDYDGDGDLDLAVANRDHRSRIYRNDGKDHNQNSVFTSAWETAEVGDSAGVAWGDYDSDGDLDLAFANRNRASQVYRNEQGSMKLAWQTNEQGLSRSVAWGDVDSDGDLDLAIGGSGYKRLYQNDRGLLTGSAIWESIETDVSQSIAWADYDNDGDLDLTVANAGFVPSNDPNVSTPVGQPLRIYQNSNGSLTRQAVWSSPAPLAALGVAWGDYDNDGDLDLAAATAREGNWLFPNSRHVRSDEQAVPQISVTRPTPPANANFYSSAEIWSGSTVSLTYLLAHPKRYPVRTVKTACSLAGSGLWQPTDVIESPLATSPEGTSYNFAWNLAQSGIWGQSDNVVCRFVAIPAIISAPNQIPGPYLYGSSAATTFPFRIRATQIQVIDELGNAVPNALVYRIPNGQSINGRLVSNGTTAFRTNGQGYLQGRGEIQPGDQFLALAPQPLPISSEMTWAISLTNSVRLYYTNGVPTPTGVTATIYNSNTPTVTQSGVQILQVLQQNPLLLFDLRVALEWNTDVDPQRKYLNQLEADLQKTSAYLYDFTNGQVALGTITVTQNAEAIGYADVVIQSTNRLRPLAVQGGVVPTTTVDPDHGNIFYAMGQVRMGATWNRYGEAGVNLGEDWPLALAHELSHYLFFVDDTYLGLDDKALLIAVDTCIGSVMGDMYDPSGINTEYLPAANWLPNCEKTLAHKTLERPEWKTIQQRYPMLFNPAHYDDNVGPGLLPYAFTTINIVSPTLFTGTALPDPIYFLNYEQGGVSSPSARAYLLRTINNHKFIFDQGSPVGGQNRLLTRGPYLGDTLCVFDLLRAHLGCETVRATDEQLDLKTHAGWNPQLEVHPITSRTLEVEVSGVPALTQPLYAQLYPEYYTATVAIPLEPLPGKIGSYRGRFGPEILTYPAPIGYLQLWAGNELNQNSPQLIVPYTMGGNLGSGPFFRGGGPFFRGGGPFFRGGGPVLRGGHAPLASSDGQMIFFNKDPDIFNEGELYVVQAAGAVPALPRGKAIIGLAYNLSASPNVTHLITGSISFQYLGVDVQALGVTEDEEAQLKIHIWQADKGWRVLQTVVNNRYNLASAASQGQGLYALMMGVTEPQVTSIEPVYLWGYNDTPLNITLYGHNLLAPVLLDLHNSAGPYSVTTILTATTGTVQIPSGLPARAYTMTLINGDNTSLALTRTLSLLDRRAGTCFYDEFEAGANQWEMEGAWGIVALPGGGHGMTDSPLGSYNSAVYPEISHSTTITSRPFDLADCAGGQLYLRHAYVLAAQGESKDWGIVEISTTLTSGWQRLDNFTGGGPYSEVVAAGGEEWTNTQWQTKTIDLDSSMGVAQLRLQLQVDQNIADKGWVIDMLAIRPLVRGSTTSLIYLPMIANQ